MLGRRGSRMACCGQNAGHLHSTQESPHCAGSARWFFPRPLPGWLLAFGLLTAVGLTLGLRALILNEAEREFQNLVERAQRAYVQRIEAAAHGLRGLVGSMAVEGGPLSRSQHRAYVESRSIDAEFPGVRGLGSDRPRGLGRPGGLHGRAA
jgi:hypothetical protein